MPRAATRDLTRLGLVLVPHAVRGRWLGRTLLLLGGVLAGAAGGHWVEAESARHAVAALPVAATAAGPSLQQQLEQSQLTLRVAESRGQELERQIAKLVQQLRESQEELTFFKKTRDAKSTPR